MKSKENREREREEKKKQILYKIPFFYVSLQENNANITLQYIQKQKL